MRIWRVVALLIVGGFSARVKDPGKDPSDWRAVKIVVNSNRQGLGVREFGSSLSKDPGSHLSRPFQSFPKSLTFHSIL